MEVYRSGSIVTLELPLVDESQQSVSNLVSISYKILDESDVLVLDWTSAPYILGAATVLLTIPSNLNQISNLTAPRAFRSVKLRMTTESGSAIYNEFEYVLEIETVLTPMLNSYQTLSQAKMQTLDMPDLTAWDNASDRKRMASMVDAFHRIGKLRFNVYGQNIPSRDNAIINNQIDLPFSGGTQWNSYYRTVPTLNAFAQNEFDVLPELFTSAIKKAQVIQANHTLGGDPISDKRAEGLMSDTVGQSSIMFRPGVPLRLTVCRDALESLAGWTSFAVQIGRT